jgi:hypothetical protein
MYRKKKEVMDDIENDVCWKYTATEITTSFLALTVVFIYIITIKIVRKQLLNKLQRTTRRYWMNRKPMRMTRPSMNYLLTRMPGNVLLYFDFVSCRKTMKTVLYLQEKPALVVISCSPSRVHCAVRSMMTLQLHCQEVGA